MICGQAWEINKYQTNTHAHTCFYFERQRLHSMFFNQVRSRPFLPQCSLKSFLWVKIPPIRHNLITFPFQLLWMSLCIPPYSVTHRAQCGSSRDTAWRLKHRTSDTKTRRSFYRNNLLLFFLFLFNSAQNFC